MKGISRFERSEWSPVADYASRVLARLGKFTPKKIGQDGFAEARGTFTASACTEIARIVSAYHGWRHTPRAERGKAWPKDVDAFADQIKVPVEKVREAVYQSRYHRWEDRYVPKVGKAARVAILKDVLQAAVERQLDAEPGKENANLIRTALQAEGEIQGTQKVTQVNIGSNVLNMPEGMTQETFTARLETVNRLAQRYREREALSVRDAESREIPQADGGGTLPGAPVEAQGRAEGAGSA